MRGGGHAVDPGQALNRPLLHPDVASLGEQVVFRYAHGQNPNGSLVDIAGVSNEAGNVVGLMPHPERASEALLGSDDGKMLFASLIAEMGRRV